MDPTDAQVLLQDAERIRGRARLRAFPLWSSGFIFALALVGGVPLYRYLQAGRLAPLATLYWVIAMPAAAGVITLLQRRASRRFGVPVTYTWLRNPALSITVWVFAAMLVGLLLEESSAAVDGPGGSALFNTGAFLANVSWSLIAAAWLALRLDGPLPLVRSVRVLALVLVVVTVILYLAAPSLFLEGALVAWALAMSGLAVAARQAVVRA